MLHAPALPDGEDVFPASRKNGGKRKELEMVSPPLDPQYYPVFRTDPFFHPSGQAQTQLLLPVEKPLGQTPRQSRIKDLAHRGLHIVFDTQIVVR